MPTRPSRFTAGALRVNAASAEYGVPRAKLYELMASGVLPYSQVSERIRVISREALVELLEDRLGVPSDLVGSAAN